jgi:hypothetical protein
MEKIRDCNTYDAAVRFINNALASSGIGLFNDIVTVQRDRENLYKLAYLWRGMLLEEESIQASSSTLPPKV